LSKPAGSRPGLRTIQGDELPLSNASFLALAQAVLGRGFSLRFQAKGFSMAPFIRDGDVLTLAPAGGKPPRAGDIVAYLDPSDGKVAVHRVISFRRGEAVIKGDNVPAPDGTFPEGSILGFVRRVERDGRVVRPGFGLAGRLVAALSARRAWQGLLSGARTVTRPFRGRRRRD
jgi:signal peptidase I